MRFQFTGSLRSHIGGVLAVVVLFASSGCASEWKKAGFSRDQAKTWEAQGFERGAAANWKSAGFDDPYLAQAWSKEVRTPWEAWQWNTEGFRPNEVESWISAGFSVSAAADARRWKDGGTGPTDAKAWRAIGGNPIVAREWTAMGFTVDQVVERLSEGFSVWDAEWIEEGFQAAEMRAWRQEDFSPRGAREWKSGGILPDEAAKWHKAGFTPEDYALFAAEDVSLSEVSPWRSQGLSAGEILAKIEEERATRKRELERLRKEASKIRGLISKRECDSAMDTAASGWDDAAKLNIEDLKDELGPLWYQARECYVQKLLKARRCTEALVAARGVRLQPDQPLIDKAIECIKRDVSQIRSLGQAKELFSTKPVSSSGQLGKKDNAWVLFYGDIMQQVDESTLLVHALTAPDAARSRLGSNANRCVARFGYLGGGDDINSCTRDAWDEARKLGDVYIRVSNPNFSCLYPENARFIFLGQNDGTKSYVTTMGGSRVVPAVRVVATSPVEILDNWYVGETNKGNYETVKDNNPCE